MAHTAPSSWQHDQWAWYETIRSAHVQYGVKNHRQFPGNHLENRTSYGSTVEATFEEQSNTRKLALYRLSAQALLDDVNLPVERPPYAVLGALMSCYNMLQDFLYSRNLITARDYAPMVCSLDEWFTQLPSSEVRQDHFDQRRRRLADLVRRYFVEPFEQYEHLISDKDRHDHRILPADPQQERLKPGFAEHEHALGTRKEIGRRAARRYSKHAGSGWSYSSV
ncbi:hypothetical protein JCM10908_000493 [Rhodotorula pacifica]|uniref:uncharacterized protein n=1 Tax=Rhodotorula pacifica TaxID=1495444 RepID=UPI0031703826